METPNFTLIHFISDENSEKAIFTEKTIKIDKIFLKKYCKSHKYVMENSLYAYLLEIQNKGDSLKITSTSCQEIYFRINGEDDWNNFYPFESITIFLNDTVTVFFQDTIISIQYVFNPFSTIPLKFPEHSIDFQQNQEKPLSVSLEGGFLHDVKIFNQNIELSNEMRKFRQTSLQRDFSRMLEMEKQTPEEKRDMNAMTFEFVQKRLLKKNIDIEWVKKKEPKNKRDQELEVDTIIEEGSETKEFEKTIIEEEDKSIIEEENNNESNEENHTLIEEENRNYVEEQNQTMEEEEEENRSQPIEGNRSRVLTEDTRSAIEVELEEEDTNNKTQEEYMEYIATKSKSKEKMVLRERKKLSFIQFFMQRPYKSTQENTHMKRYNKVMDKNKNSLDDICVICLEKIQKSVAKISCTHLFCFECIKDWSQITNSCPLCKKEFLAINHYSLKNVFLSVTPVEPRKQKIDDDMDFTEIDNTDETCYNCNLSNSTNLLIICDKCNFFCCHTYCDNPPLRNVPIGEWYCKWCREEMNMHVIEEISDESEALEGEGEREKKYVTRSVSRNLTENNNNGRRALRERRNRVFM